MTAPNPLTRWGACLVAAGLACVAAPAWAASDVGLVTRVVGEAEITYAGASEATAALDFVTVKADDRYALPDGATVEVVFFDPGRRERWEGPVSFTITAAGGSPANSAKSTVTTLPPAAVKALRGVPRRKASTRARPGGFRVRGTEPEQRLGGTRAQKKAKGPMAPPQFDDQAARLHADALLALADDSAGAAPLKLAALRLSVALEGAGADEVRRLGREVGFEIAKSRAAVTVKRAGAGRVEVRVAKGPTWTVGDDLVALGGALTHAARAARILGLVAAATGDRATRVGVNMVPVGGKPKSRLAVKTGDRLSFETWSKGGHHLFYAIVEIGPTPAVGVVYPSSSSPSILGPEMRRREPLTFAASPPLGDYQYVMLATASPKAWWHGAPGLAEPTDMADVLQQVLRGRRPAAAVAVQVRPWSAATSDLEIRAGR